MTKAKEILKLTGMSRKDIAKNCSVTSEAVTKWIYTNRIPNHQWQKLIDISHGRITWDVLENLNKKKGGIKCTKQVIRLR